MKIRTFAIGIIVPPDMTYEGVYSKIACRDTINIDLGDGVSLEIPSHSIAVLKRAVETHYEELEAEKQKEVSKKLIPLYIIGSVLKLNTNTLHARNNTRYSSNERNFRVLNGKRYSAVSTEQLKKIAPEITDKQTQEIEKQMGYIELYSNS